jgi:uncharacterized membrane protein YuzA (DUF378 family)
MKTLDTVVAVQFVIGGLDRGLVALLSFELVKAVFGDMTILARLVYILVGLSAAYQSLQWEAIRRRRGLSRA